MTSFKQKALKVGLPIAVISAGLVLLASGCGDGGSKNPRLSRSALNVFTIHGTFESPTDGDQNWCGQSILIGIDDPSACSAASIDGIDTKEFLRLTEGDLQNPKEEVTLGAAIPRELNGCKWRIPIRSRMKERTNYTLFFVGGSQDLAARASAESAMFRTAPEFTDKYCTGISDFYVAGVYGIGGSSRVDNVDGLFDFLDTSGAGFNIKINGRAIGETFEAAINQSITTWLGTNSISAASRIQIQIELSQQPSGLGLQDSFGIFKANENPNDGIVRNVNKRQPVYSTLDGRHVITIQLEPNDLEAGTTYALIVKPNLKNYLNYKISNGTITFFRTNSSSN